MTEGLLIKRRLRVVLVGVLIAVSSIMIKGTTGQSLELGCPLKVQFSFQTGSTHHMSPSRLP